MIATRRKRKAKPRAPMRRLSAHIEGTAKALWISLCRLRHGEAVQVVLARTPRGRATLLQLPIDARKPDSAIWVGNPSRESPLQWFLENVEAAEDELEGRIHV